MGYKQPAPRVADRVKVVSPSSGYYGRVATVLWSQSGQALVRFDDNVQRVLNVEALRIVRKGAE